MASYDLTPRIAPNLDRHLVFPLLEFLQERQLHPDEQILKAKIELLNKTNMVDYAMDIHKNLYHTDDVPQDMLERRAEVVARLKYLEDAAAPLVDFLQNPTAVQELRADKHYNLQMLNDRYQIGPDQIEALYRYAKFQFECGNYSGAADYLHQYRALCTNSERSLSALWGKLAAEILMQNWDIALDELNRVKEIIDSKSFSSPLNQVQNRIWLMHRSLFIFFNHDNGRTQIIDLFYQDNYLKAIQTSAPHLLRYLATAFIVNKRRKPQFKDFIKVIQQEQCSYKDPITEFLLCVYVNYDFDGAQKKMKECEEVILNDPFLGKRVEEGNFSTVLLIDEFLENARLFIFETSCRIHQNIDMGRLAYTNHLDKEVTQEISLTHSEASVSNPHEFKRALESVEILASQSVLNLIEGHANPSPSIVVDKARRQIPKTIRPIVPKVSSFSADQVIYDCQAKLVMTLWQSIQSKLARTPFNQLSSIESEVQKILCAMEEMKSVDSSSLRNMVQEYFDHVKSFSDLEYSFSSRLSAEDKTKKLQALEVRLRELDALQGNLLSELGEFEKELKDLESRKKQLESFIQEHEEALKKTIADTSQIRDKMTSIESIPIISEGEVKSLGILQSTLESSRDELKNYKWKA